jgi:hypothetical protein
MRHAHGAALGGVYDGARRVQFVAVDVVDVVDEGGQGRYGDIAHLEESALLELLKESGVERLEGIGEMAGQHDAAPDAVGGSRGDGVVAATAPEGALRAQFDGPPALAGLKEKFGIFAARQLLVGREQTYVWA